MSLPIIIATILRPDGDTGVQTHFRTFSNWLNDSQKPATIVTPFSTSKIKIYPTFALRRLIAPINGSAGVWWYRHWHTFFLRNELREVLADGQPCIIYAQCPLSAGAALEARKSPVQRVLMVVHFNLSQADEWCDKGEIPYDGYLFKSIRRFEETILPRADGLVFVSQFMRNELIKRIPALKHTEYRVVPNFLPSPHLGKTKETPAADLICIGTLEPRKNQRYALEIIAATKRLGKPLNLTVIGDGPDREDLEKIAKKLKIAENVFFLGFVKQAANRLTQHAAYLHVSHMENLPIAPIEAMSRGLPIFAPAVGGIPEIFTDGVEGRVIPLDNAEEAARLILDWMKSPHELVRAGNAARNKFISTFEISITANKLLEFLSPHAHQK